MLFIAAVYVSKLTFYSFPFRIDYIIYLKFVRFRLSTLQISRLYNLAFALFMFSSLYGARQLLKTDTKRLIMLSLPIIAFLILTHPMVRRNLYLHSYYIYSSDFSTLAGGALKIGFQLLLTFYLLFPYYYIAKFYRQTNYRIKRQNILILSLCITVINVFFCSVFMFGSFKNLLFYNVNPVGIPFEMITLSSNELEVLTDIYNGKTYNEIAQERFVENTTVRSMCSRILRKFQAQNMNELITNLRDMKIFDSVFGE